MVMDLQYVQAAANFRVGHLHTSCTVSPRAVQGNLVLQRGCVLPLQLETRFPSARRRGDGQQVWDLHNYTTKTSCNTVGTSRFMGLDIYTQVKHGAPEELVVWDNTKLAQF